MGGLCVVDAHARADQEGVHPRRIEDLHAAGLEQRVVRVARIEREGRGHLAGPGEAHRAALAPATLRDVLVPRHGLAGADQHRRAAAFDVGDHVEHVVHAVAEVHVRAPGRPPHGHVARGSAAVAVARRIVGKTIGLELGDPQRDGPVPDQLAE